MMTAIDTNVLVALWDEEESEYREARAALERALHEGALVISGTVYAELLAAPGRTEQFLDQFCEDARISVDWTITEPIWREAGRAFQGYAGRRRKQGDGGPRRILADFVIGAHAAHHKYRLLTMDARVYKAAFPRLAIATF